MADPYRLVLELHVQDTGHWTLLADGRLVLKLVEGGLTRTGVALALGRALVGELEGWFGRLAALERAHAPEPEDVLERVLALAARVDGQAEADGLHTPEGKRMRIVADQLRAFAGGPRG